MHYGWFSHLKCNVEESLHCLKECLTEERFAKLVQPSRTAVTRLYNSSSVELITHASVAVLQSLTLEQTELPAELCFFHICLVGTVSRFVQFYSKWMLQ